MQTTDHELSCSQCGSKMGMVTLFGGTMNVFDVKACCLSCLPKRLDDLERLDFSPDAIKRARSWLSS